MASRQRGHNLSKFWLVDAVLIPLITYIYITIVLHEAGYKQKEHF